MQLRRVLILISAVVLSPTYAVHTQTAPDSGLKAEITGVSIPANRRPVITFKISDAKGKSLDLDDLDPNSAKFTIAALKIGKSGENDYPTTSLVKSSAKTTFTKTRRENPLLQRPWSRTLIREVLWFACAQGLLPTPSRHRSRLILTARRPTWWAAR